MYHRIGNVATLPHARSVPLGSGALRFCPRKSLLECLLQNLLLGRFPTRVTNRGRRFTAGGYMAHTKRRFCSRRTAFTNPRRSSPPELVMVHVRNGHQLRPEGAWRSPRGRQRWTERAWRSPRAGDARAPSWALRAAGACSRNHRLVLHNLVSRCPTRHTEVVMVHVLNSTPSGLQQRPHHLHQL